MLTWRDVWRMALVLALLGLAAYYLLEMLAEFGSAL
jgi:hypothetical protein